MEHKFKVGDRVKHPVAGIGTVTYLLKGKYDCAIFSFDWNAVEEICLTANIEKYEPEKPQPKYKPRDIVWTKTVVLALPDDDGEYYLEAFHKDADGDSVSASYAKEENLRPLHDEPIKPEEVKEGVPIWIKGYIGGNIVHQDGEVRVRIRRNPKYENNLSYVLASEMKLRHEDE